MKNKIQVEVVMASLENMKCDVLVNTTSPSLQLNSGVASKALLAAGGNTLQTECQQKYPNGVKAGDFAVTSGGSLNCKAVYHTTCLGWGSQNCETTLGNLITNCLNKANGDNMKSIAFPAVGTGGHAIPADVVAKVMCESINNFKAANSNPSLRKISIVLYPLAQTVIQAFKAYYPVQDLDGQRTSDSEDSTPVAEVPTGGHSSEWEKITDGSGKYFFVNHVTHTTQFEIPPGFNEKGQAATAAAPPPPSPLPDTWVPMDLKDLFKKIQLNNGSPEYKEVADFFYKSCQDNWPIQKIERIQNPTMFQQYMIKKSGMKTPGERQLWHGTPPDVTDQINARGFDRNLSGKNATIYGQGSYFAVNSKYSQTYAKVKNGIRSMYLCKVLTGEYTTGSSEMKAPPAKDKRNPHITYDAVVDNNETPVIFVVFADSQAYPEYLLTFG